MINPNVQKALTQLKEYSKYITTGLEYVEKNCGTVTKIDETALFAVIRSIAVNGRLSQAEVDAINAVLRGEKPPVIAHKDLTPDDFKWAQGRLSCTYAQIRAVDEVESGGGWFNDMRADILELDGPDGFLDGPSLPKLLFEAHVFSRLTDGLYDSSHPNLSSPKWNKALYVGGQGEWARLWKAMSLDKEAALQSASYGRYQIMGFNYKLAGFGSVEAFVDAMKKSERLQLEAFVNFIINSGLTDELQQISNVHADCIPFAKGYNGTGYAQNEYHIKLAKAHKKYQTQGQGG